MKGNFDNSFILTRFMLRRERIISSVWIVVLVFVVVGLVPGMQAALDPESRASLMPMLEMPAMIAMIGPAYAADYDTFGPLYSTFMLLFTAFTVGIMNIFLVVRHTRADEEKGRYEVVRSLPTGRLATLNAAMITAVIVNAVMSIAIGLGMYALGDESMDFNGSMLWGASLGAVGLVFAALSAVFCQLSASSRSASGYSFTALFILYILRAPGDMNADLESLAIISPLGLVLRTKAYMTDHWWPIFLMLGTAIVISIVAYRLNYSRDIEQGLIPARAGRAHGSFLLRTPSGLTFKLLKTSLIVWVVGLLSLAAAYGTILDGVDDFIANNEMYQQLMLGPAGVEFLEGMTPEESAAAMREAVNATGYTLPQLYTSMTNSMMGMLSMVPLLLFILKAKSEERDIRSELILATPVSRNKYLAGFAVIAFVSAVIMQLTLAIGMYSMALSVLPDVSELSLGYLLEANLVIVPALWVMVGAAILLVGLLPKATGAVWGYFGYTFLIIFVGRLDIFPEVMSRLTPFGYVPQLPMDETNFLTLGLLTAVAAVLTFAGFIFYGKRDVNAITH